MSATATLERPATDSATGAPLDRVDGRAKATGAARYTADEPIPGLVHAVLVGSTIASGHIVRLDCAAAEAAPGVLAVLTHENMPKLRSMRTFNRGGTALQAKPPLQDDRVDHAGQPVALVVAETLEQARSAARLLRIDYAAQPVHVELSDEPSATYTPRSILGEYPDHTRGDPASALAAADVRVEATYTTPIEHHNPLEPVATIAHWDGDGKLTLYETTQGVSVTRMAAAQALGLPRRKVRVVSRLVGGGFGCKGIYGAHTTLAAIAARRVGRPVTLVLTRAQMFTSVGHRAGTLQRLSLGATRDGTLTALVHQTTSTGSRLGEFPEPAAEISKHLYATPNLTTRYRVARLDLGVPTAMRAPGEAPGSFALESAIDELADALAVDPIALRLRNFGRTDPATGRLWPGATLRECLEEGARRFDWAARTPEPGSMRDGRWLVGRGVAAAYFRSVTFPAVARVRLGADGRVLVRSATADLGTGTSTILTQIAAEALGLPPPAVTVELGDSALPFTAGSGGSSTARSVGPAVHAAALAARAKVVKLALADPASPLHGAQRADVVATDGELLLRSNPTRRDSYGAILTRRGLSHIEERRSTGWVEAASELLPIVLGPRLGGVARRLTAPFVGKYAGGEFGAQFVEVRVDPDLGLVRVSRALGVFAIGRVLNQKTARSQAIGAITGGIGMALLEQTSVHPTLGAIVSPNLSGYLLPTHADIPAIDAHFVGEPDLHANALGAKGVGEIGIVGVAAAIANAVYHATGRRVRDLPITPEKLLIDERASAR